MLRWAVHNAMPDGRDLDEHLTQLRAALTAETGQPGLDRWTEISRIC